MQTLAVFLFILPVLTLSADDPLFGTWVNEEYDKLERFEEARSVVYTSCASRKPGSMGPGTIGTESVGPAGCIPVAPEKSKGTPWTG